MNGGSRIDESGTGAGDILMHETSDHRIDIRLEHGTVRSTHQLRSCASLP
jgi:hypothetical protein